MQKDVTRSINLDRETDRLLDKLARRYEDNRSLCMRELIRKAAEQYEPKARPGGNSQTETR